MSFREDGPLAQNAPGKHYREGISLIELFERFPNDATSRAGGLRNSGGARLASRATARCAV